jgi:uncharacterized membrane protein
MGMLDIFGKKDVGDALVGGIPYGLKLRFRPLRMNTKDKTPVDLIIDLENLHDEEALLTSVVVQVPKVFGLDSMGLNTLREIRLGHMKGRESKQLTVEIYPTARTKAGDFPVQITAFCHYRDYSHILNSMKQRIELRVI